MSILIPSIDGPNVTVAAVMAQPTWLRAKIADLTEGNELLSTFFSPAGATVTGGGILHPRLTGADRYTADDVVERGPGDEYQRVRAIDPDYRLALVKDYGATVEITDEEIDRGDISALNNKVSQLSNTLTRKLNVKALEAIDDAQPDEIPASAAWTSFITVGPADQITPHVLRPLSDLLRARNAFVEDRLGFLPDTLLLSSDDALALSIGYAEDLSNVLTAAGLTMVTNPYVPAGRAYVVQKGKPGIVGYERPLTVDIIDQREKRQKLIQVYAVPAFAVDRPQATKVVTATVQP